MLKIVLVARAIYPYVLGGMERHGGFLANSLVDLGAKVDVICPTVEKVFDEEFKVKFETISFPWPKKRSHLLSYWLFTKKAGEKILEGDYDVAYGEGLGLWGYLSKKQIPCISNFHGMEQFKQQTLKDKLKFIPMCLASQYVAKKSDIQISSGGHLTNETVRFLKIPREKIRVIPNAVSLEYIDKRLSGLRAEKDKEKITLLFINRLAFNKGADLLIEAFKKLKNKKNLDLVFVGGGPDSQALEQMAAGEENIKFAGRVSEEELYNWFKKANCFVFPSRFEGMPTVVLEAMAASLPVIATDIGALPTMVDKENGFLITPNSVEALVESLEKFLNLNQEEKEGLGRASRSRIEERFSWPQVAKQTLNLCKELVGKEIRSQKFRSPE